MAKTKQGQRAKEVRQKRAKQQPAKSQTERDKEIVDSHRSRLVSMENRRDQKEEIWQDLADYVLPDFEDIEQTEEPGERVGQRIFDGTAPVALDIATNGTYGNVMNQGSPWFSLRAWLNDLNEIAEVRSYLQDVQEQILFALARSNFYEESLSLVRGGIGIGTSTMMSEVDEAKDIIVFEHIHPAQAFIAENKNRRVDTLYRKYRAHLADIAERFGKESLSESQQRTLVDSPYSQIEILHVIAERKDFDPFKYDNINMPYASIWIDLSEGRLLHESGFNEQPFTTWRYLKNAGDFYGRCPAELALPSIIGANRTVEDMLAVSELSAMPPMRASTNMRGKVKMTSRGLNYMTAEDFLEPINLGQNYGVGVDREERQQEAIRAAFNVDFFLLLSSADASRTAFEVAELQSERALILAPAVSRLTAEVLDSVLERVFSIEERAGRMPIPPPILEDLGPDGQIDIQYLGPLAQIQARLFENRGIIGGMGFVGEIAAAFPGAVDNVDDDELIRAAMRSFNFPQKTIRSQDDVAALRVARQQDQADAAQLAKAESLGKAAKDLGQAGVNVAEPIEQAIEGVAQ